LTVVLQRARHNIIPFDKILNSSKLLSVVILGTETIGKTKLHMI
jgi:hypothetical protein